MISNFCSISFISIEGNTSFFHLTTHSSGSSAEFRALLWLFSELLIRFVEPHIPSWRILPPPAFHCSGCHNPLFVVHSPLHDVFASSSTHISQSKSYSYYFQPLQFYMLPFVFAPWLFFLQISSSYLFLLSHTNSVRDSTLLTFVEQSESWVF